MFSARIIIIIIRVVRDVCIRSIYGRGLLKIRKQQKKKEKPDDYFYAFGFFRSFSPGNNYSRISDIALLNKIRSARAFSKSKSFRKRPIIRSYIIIHRTAYSWRRAGYNLRMLADYYYDL